MVSRVLACTAAVVILGLACYQYQSRRELNKVQKQYRRVTEQAEIGKLQEQKIDSQQQRIESLQRQVQVENDILEKRLTRLEGLLRARRKLQRKPTLRSRLSLIPCESTRHRVTCAAAQAGAAPVLLSLVTSMN